MPGDMGDDFRALKQASKEKRASNRDGSARLLTEAGIPFVSKNNGAHLIVAQRYDFWPGTGKWITRGLGGKGTITMRGVRNLIARIKQEGSR